MIDTEERLKAKISHFNLSCYSGVTKIIYITIYNPARANLLTLVIIEEYLKWGIS